MLLTQFIKSLRALNGVTKSNKRYFQLKMASGIIRLSKFQFSRLNFLFFFFLLVFRSILFIFHFKCVRIFTCHQRRKKTSISLKCKLKQLNTQFLQTFYFIFFFIFFFIFGYFGSYCSKSGNHSF